MSLVRPQTRAGRVCKVTVLISLVIAGMALFFTGLNNVLECGVGFGGAHCYYTSPEVAELLFGAWLAAMFSSFAIIPLMVVAVVAGGLCLVRKQW